MSLTIAIPGRSAGNVGENSLPSILFATSPAQAVVVLIAVSALIRMAISGTAGLGIDESYTVANARTFDWSYVDYPPLHVWLVGAWAWLWNTESPLVVRLPFIALFAGSTWLMFRLTALLFGERAGLWAAILLNLAPVFTLAGASWVLPDGPLTFLMLFAAYVVSGLLFANSKPSNALAGWLAAGLLAGLAMLTKYHGAFLLAGTFVFLLTWPTARNLLASPSPWLGAALALLIFQPVLAWNAHHDWAGLFFQSRRITKSVDLGLLRVVTGVAGQAAYLSPWLFVPLVAVWLRALRNGPTVPRTWFLALLATGPIVFFTAANVFSQGLPHWPMPGWLFTFPLLGAEVARLQPSRPKLVMFAGGAVAAVLIIAVAIFASDASNGWLARQFPVRVAKSDPTIDLLNWTELGTVVADRHLLDKDTPAMAGTHWFEAAKLNYAIGRDVPVLCICADPQQFRYLRNLSQFAGRNILIVESEKEFSRHGAVFAHWFERLQVLAPIALHRAGENVLQLVVIRGIGFRLPEYQRAAGLART